MSRKELSLHIFSFTISTEEQGGLIKTGRDRTGKEGDVPACHVDIGAKTYEQKVANPIQQERKPGHPPSLTC